MEHRSQSRRFSGSIQSSATPPGHESPPCVPVPTAYPSSNEGYAGVCTCAVEVWPQTKRTCRAGEHHELWQRVCEWSERKHGPAGHLFVIGAVKSCGQSDGLERGV